MCLYQIGTLKRAEDTQWGFYLGSICSLMKLFSAICSILSNIINGGATSKQRAEVDGVYDAVTSFEFVFILHFMRKIKGHRKIYDSWLGSIRPSSMFFGLVHGPEGLSPR